MAAPVEVSRTVSLTVSGTPAAVVVEEPKLDRMSERTMPESSRTLTPLDPSAGYGPPVSSGTSVRVPSPLAELVDEPLELLELLEVPLDVVEEEAPVAVDPVPVLQAASAARAPTPPRRPSARRRFIVPRS